MPLRFAPNRCDNLFANRQRLRALSTNRTVQLPTIGSVFPVIRQGRQGSAVAASAAALWRAAKTEGYAAARGTNKKASVPQSGTSVYNVDEAYK